jgi:thiamine biosynthesis protein ThiS
MTIILNGEKKEIPDGITVFSLLEHLNIQHRRVAVERNEEIVTKSSYAETVLKEGDALEVVSFMGGGDSSSECGVRSAVRLQRRRR